MRILITGSRSWPREDFGQIESVLSDYIRRHIPIDEPITFVVGDCPSGVDSYINSPDFMATFGIGRIADVQKHVANWNSREGSFAGLRRNERMVKTGADICFAFTYGSRMESRGTRHCARNAKEAGIDVHWVNHDRECSNVTSIPIQRDRRGL
jgi:hypothetical protein